MALKGHCNGNDSKVSITTLDTLNRAFFINRLKCNAK